MDRLRPTRIFSRWTNPRLAPQGSLASLDAGLPLPVTPGATPAIPVLLVGRDDELRVGLGGLLEEDLFHLDEAADGPGALATLRATRQPMVVVLNCRPPRVQGWQVLSEVYPDSRRADRALTRHTYLAIINSSMPLSEAMLGLLRQPRLRVVEWPLDAELLVGAVTLAALDLVLH